MGDHVIDDTEDDQLYYTQIYLDQSKRVGVVSGVSVMASLLHSGQTSLGMRLDHRSHFFQNLNGAKDEVDVRMNQTHATVVNSIYDTTPAVLHGNGPSKVYTFICGDLNYSSVPTFSLAGVPELPHQLCSGDVV